jgi:hypothetical protein
MILTHIAHYVLRNVASYSMGGGFIGFVHSFKINQIASRYWHHANTFFIKIFHLHETSKKLIIFQDMWLRKRYYTRIVDFWKLWTSYSPDVITDESINKSNQTNFIWTNANPKCNENQSKRSDTGKIYKVYKNQLELTLLTIDLVLLIPLLR